MQDVAPARASEAVADLVELSVRSPSTEIHAGQQRDKNAAHPSVISTGTFSLITSHMPLGSVPSSSSPPFSPPSSPTAAPTNLFSSSPHSTPENKVYGLSALSGGQLESANNRRVSIRRKMSLFARKDGKELPSTPIMSRKSSLASSVSYSKPAGDARRRMSVVAPPGAQADWLTSLRDVASSAVEIARLRSKAIIAAAQPSNSPEAVGKRGRAEALVSLLVDDSAPAPEANRARRRSSVCLVQMQAAAVGYDVQSLPRRASRIVLPEDLPEEVGPPARADHAMILFAMPEIARLPSSISQITATTSFDQISYKAGATVLEAGGPLDSLYLVKSGAFATYAKIVGNGNTPLCIFRAGERLGDRALFYTDISQFAIRCVESGELLSILGDDYRKLIQHVNESTHAIWN